MSPHYEVTDAQRLEFATRGYVHLPGVLSSNEVKEIASVYDQFMSQSVEVEGKDLCDMAGDYGRKVDEFSIFNVLLPRKYYPKLQGNMFEERAKHIAQQLYGGDAMELDFDQLVAKNPFKEDAVFAWHQDMAYWPRTPDERTATVWLAIDESTLANGCMRFVPGSHREKELRQHKPLFGSNREESHALATDLRDDDKPHTVPIRSGDVTVHNERVLHGSGGNSTSGLRRAYILAFRRPETVRIEREMGFNHSHNNDAEVLQKVG